MLKRFYIWTFSSITEVFLPAKHCEVFDTEAIAIVQLPETFI